jgi:hypothetical protein
MKGPVRFMLGLTIFLTVSVAAAVTVNALTRAAEEDRSAPRTPRPIAELTSPHLPYKHQAPADARAIICAQGVGITPEAEHEAAIRLDAALDEIRGTPDWEDYAVYFGDSEKLMVGCRSPVSFDGAGHEVEDRMHWNNRGAGSAYLNVYVYPEGAFVDDWRSRITTEVVESSGDSSSSDGVGLYVMPSEVCRKFHLFVMLEDAFGMFGITGLPYSSPTPPATQYPACF